MHDSTLQLLQKLGSTASNADLLIAATAELNGLTVLHKDKDFNLVAGITGQELDELAVTES